MTGSATLDTTPIGAQIMPLRYDSTLRETLTHRTNAYDPITAEFEQRAGCGWHQPAPIRNATADLSVVIPAHNAGYSLPMVLDALADQTMGRRFEVIVVDDGSTDDTRALALAHRLDPVVVATGRHLGSGVARNLGTAVAAADTIVYLDADMVVGPTVLAEFSARADERLVLIGFRHNVPYQAGEDGQPVLPDSPADLYADHRATWRPPVGKQLLHTGITLTEPLEGRPLDATDDLRRLGFGRTYYDWDLPRMTVTALMAAPRRAIVAAGGFHPGFSAIGWGSEDTFLGACLIAVGLMVVPLRHVVGYHLDPPDAEEAWKAKLATWPATVELYHQLLCEPPPHDLDAEFTARTAELLAGCEVKQ